MAIVNRKNLLEAGAHFGHKKANMNPKMKPYIYGSRGGVSIIDLEKSIRMIDSAYEAMKELAENGGRILFVGTKKQASSLIKREAERAELFYINSRWLGGTLTNLATIRKSVDKLEKLESADTTSYTKKELALHNRQLEKLTRNFHGIREMRSLPDAIFVATADKDQIAIDEAAKLGVTIFAIADSDNASPESITHLMPANDDAVKSLNLLVETMANAVIKGKGIVVTEEAPVESKSEEVKVVEQAAVTKEASNDTKESKDEHTTS